MSAYSQESQVLVVDDEETSSIILSSILKSMTFEVDSCSTKAQMVSKLSSQSYHYLFLDYRLGQENGLEILQDVIKDYPKLQVILITGHGSIELALDAMHLGASGFISKPFDPEKVEAEILRTARSRSKARLFKPETFEDGTGIIGSSHVVARIHDQINKMKDVNSTVLIHGESGTGKELIARALHTLSKRGPFAFEALNCAAIPENLIEAELFGYKKGAFTDAKIDRQGMFEACDGGSLFLDEIGELPLALQSKLLRVLQEKVIAPLGAAKSKRIDTRVIFATNRNLLQEVQKGNFRNDLYYRVSILQIESPPLRNRPEDIPLLVRYFIEKISKEFGKKIRFPTPEVMTRLENYDWPGNIRELQNSLERAIVMAEGETLSLKDIFSFDHQSDDSSKGPQAPFQVDLKTAKDQFEKQYLVDLLKSTKGNVSEASKIAGRVRTDMYRLFSKHDINPNQFS